MSAMQTAIYVGTVTHRRLKPREHAFRYRAYWLAFDLDELPELNQTLRWFSYNGRNLFSFHDADHGDGSQTPLRAQIECHLARSGIDLGGGAIRVLCMPRVLGFVFNPLSVHFCHDASGRIRAIVYQVHNTFRQRHSYLICASPTNSIDDGGVEQACAKRFYVSPFMPMDMHYRFKVIPPGENVAVTVCGDDTDGPLIVASLWGRRRALTDAALLRLFFTLPLITMKTVAAIHWEALRLWLKGLRLVPRPAPPAASVSASGGIDRVAAE